VSESLRRFTVESETVAAVDFRVDADKIGNIRILDKKLVKHLLAGVVELIRKDAASETKAVVEILADDIIESAGEPPDT